MDKHTDLTETELDTLFAEARDAAPMLSDGLAARIMADAARVSAKPAPALAPPPRPSALQSLWDAIGGWPAAAGLMTAAVTGLTIGLSATTSLEPLTGLITGYDVEDFMPAYSGLLSEG